ncbi:MAG: carboxypeptidase-like regulatory domain-containing protein [Terracidiphilus sp.]
MSGATGAEISAPLPDAVDASAGSAAVVSGTVLDTDGAEVQDARVVLESPNGDVVRKGQSGDNGEFTFNSVQPGAYELVVSGPGWGTYTSPALHLKAGDFRIVPNIVLPLTSSSVVRVSADPEQLAEEQVHIAEQQRVLGVIPNFYSSYDWNAPPMHAKQKFQLSLRSLIDPMEFVGVAATAGMEQQANVFSGYGTGAAGYGKRLGAAYANDFTANFFADAVFPAIFHQDPRYFYKGKGSIGSRALYAISSAVIARGDNGHWQPNYSYIFGSFAAGGVSNLYYPAADRGASLVLMNGLANIGAHAGADLIREFVLKRFTSKANGVGIGQP